MCGWSDTDVFCGCMWHDFHLTSDRSLPTHVAQFRYPSIQCGLLQENQQPLALTQCSKEWLRGKKQWLDQKPYTIWRNNFLVLSSETRLTLSQRQTCMNEGINLCFMMKESSCCLKRASSSALIASSHTSQDCIIQAFYYYSLHVNVSCSPYKLAAVNTASAS